MDWVRSMKLSAVALRVVVAGAFALLAAGVATAGARAERHEGAEGRATTLTVDMSTKAVKIEGSKTRHAGRFVFHADAGGHGHVLVVASLAKGYALHDALKDVNAALNHNGRPEMAAIRRIDHKIHWYGGVSAPGTYSVTLGKGHYYLLDEGGHGLARLTVTGSVTSSPPLSSEGTIDAVAAHHGDRFSSASVLPASGWVTFRNRTDEPHFLSLVEVKPSTSNADINKHIRDEHTPAFVLSSEAESAPISPGTTVQVLLDLPKGKYLMACFWPSIENGMPHAFMGMWKLVHLR